MQEALETGTITSLSSLHHFQKYTESILVRSEDGWKDAIIKVTKEDLPQLGESVFEYVFRYRDMATWLTETFGNKDFKGHFAMKYKEKINDRGGR